MTKNCCGDDIKRSPKESERTTSDNITAFKVSGMDCSDEVAAIQRIFRIDGVIKVDANIMNETVTIYHDNTLLSANIKLLIEKAGVKVVSTSSESFFKEHLSRIFQISASGFFLGVGLLLNWLESSHDLIVNGFYFGSISLAGFIIFPKTWRSIRKFHLDMNVLMSVAVIGAVLINEVSEAASVVFLFSLAELLEAMSVAKARKAIRDVLKVAPREASLIESPNTLKRVDVESLKIGDLILVKPGESIPVDGTIHEGNSSVNQASLTGESLPVPKQIGETVWAGTINESSVLKIRVDKGFQDTKISKVIALVEEAQAQRAPSQKFVDKFASIYTPGVMILAILVALIPPVFWSASWEVWIYKALVLLVIGCPCALVIATPVSVVSGLTSLARRGVLVKGGVHLESLGKLQVVALDKTGTITKGTPKVIEMKSFSNSPEEKTLQIISSLESMSTHPLAKAIMDFTHKKNISYQHPENYKIVTGKGAEGQLDGHWYFVGNHLMAHEFGICTPEVESFLSSIEDAAMSVIVLGHKPHDSCKGEILAVFAVGDQIRPTVKDAIKSFHDAGIKVAMLSGDNQKTASAVAKEVGIDYAKGALLPEQKVLEVKTLVAQYRYVGMVGDGVNDAPALAHATVGIAMGIAGSDTAIETADIALMKDEISELPKAIAHGKRVLRVIQFNIIFAILIKAIFFVLAFLGLSNLWLAVAADMGASLLVTFNALRLLKINANVSS
ncbi:MAG: cadmium-translocating P-type ATPase [Bacteriovoracaceae bacterium]|nr:cadmium-translocating P-type ATPase [Bacteriovoracaceae bacterium]